jgi:hypothetical protein
VSTLSSLCIASSSNAPRTNVPDTTHQRLSPPTGPSPTYSLIGSSQHADSSSYYEPELVTPQTTSPEAVQGPVPAGLSQARGSPQPNKTMFDFVSPFDALASPSAAPVRNPAQPSSHQQGPSEPFEDTWTSVIDPKRKSVDNLLEQIGHTNAPVLSAQPISFDEHSPGDETPMTELVQSKAASRPLPPKPMQAPSPRSSPPKATPPVRRDIQTSESPFGPQVGPVLSHVPTGTTQREKESSPGPRGSWKGHEGGRNRGSGSKVKAPSGPK